MRIAARILRLADERSGGVPVVRAVAVVEEEATPPLPVTTVPMADEPQLAAALTSELEALYRIDLLRAARSRGWEVSSADGAAVYLIASLGEPPGASGLLPLADLVRRLASRHVARQSTLTAVLLSPSEGQIGNLPYSIPFDEGCYLLERVNEYGLALAGDDQLEEMVARWVIEATFTPLGQHLASLPLPTGEHVGFGSFGLACWEFPAQALADHLSCRLRLELLDCLLAPVAGVEAAAAALLRSRCAPPSLRSDESFDYFRIRGEAWARPGLARLASLRAEIDGAVGEEMTRLQRRKERGDRMLEESLGEAGEGLEAEIAAMLDAPGCGRLYRVEETLALTRQALAQQTKEAQEAARYWEERRAVLQAATEKAGKALETAIARFPPWKLRVWLGVLTRPWRCISLWRCYLEIVECATAYLACREEEWLLTARTLEQGWLATFYARMAGAVEEWEERLRSFRTQVEEMREILAISHEDEEQVACLLEGAALPPTLGHHLYTRTVAEIEGELAALLAASGPLSGLVMGEDGVDRLQRALQKHAEERFRFLEAVRLDELLARTYAGEELRERLADLLEAARPFWACDETGLTPAEREGLVRRAWVGLPRVADSPLADLLPERGVTPYDTGQQGQVLAVQVRLGLPLRTLADAPP